jgi:hypothetical protein
MKKAVELLVEFRPREFHIYMYLPQVPPITSGENIFTAVNPYTNFLERFFSFKGI